MGTALKYKQDLDFSKPLSEQFGGRLLTVQEADALFETVSSSVYEYVAMNLEHLLNREMSDVADDDSEMTPDGLAALLVTAKDLRQHAAVFSELAGKIDRLAWGLWEAHEDRPKGGE